MVLCVTVVGVSLNFLIIIPRSHCKTLHGAPVRGRLVMIPWTSPLNIFKPIALIAKFAEFFYGSVAIPFESCLKMRISQCSFTLPFITTLLYDIFLTDLLKWLDLFLSNLAHWESVFRIKFDWENKWSVKFCVNVTFRTITKNGCNKEKPFNEAKNN